MKKLQNLYKFAISNIDWDTEDWTEEEELASGVCVPDLPKEIDDFEVIAYTEDEARDMIAGRLSNEYEYCVNDFVAELISVNDF